MSIEERFWSKVDRSTDCWLWTKGVDKNGYGKFWAPGHTPQNAMAHRFAYEICVGPIPGGLEIDHICRRHRCVRPDHLDPVPHGENARRGSRGRMVTQCPKGHPYDEANTYWRPGQVESRNCRKCHAINERDRRRRRREAATHKSPAP